MSIKTHITKLGYAEYCLLPDDGKRHEIVDGNHYMNPAPTPDHQSVSKHLQYFLYTQIELPGLGQVFNAPIDVQLGEFDIVQPDLIVLLKKCRAKITRTRIIGPPDLVVEILSGSTRNHDSKLKRSLYERAGIREYWIADPAKKHVTQLHLIDGTYKSIRNKVGSKELRLVIAPAISIPLDKIWAR
jgi:Uma2 family endonuclease